MWTIEHALEKALVEKGVVSEDNAGSFTKVFHVTVSIHFTRTVRIKVNNLI